MTACKRCGGTGKEVDGKGLRGLRGGLSLRAMAAYVGVSHVYLGDVERGKGISGVQLRRIERAYRDATNAR